MMTTRFLLLALAAPLALGTLTARAAEDVEEPKMAGYKLKNRSSYTAAEKARAPFWPIGWAKGQQVMPASDTPVAPTLTSVKLDPEMFAVTSILISRPSFVVINSISYAEGEYVRLPRPKATDQGQQKTLPPGTRVRVAKINDGSVVLESGGQLTEIAMRRPTLSGHKMDDGGADLLKPVSER